MNRGLEARGCIVYCIAVAWVPNLESNTAKAWKFRKNN